MRWLELSIEASGEAAEALAALFHRWGHGGAVLEPVIAPGDDADEYLVPDGGQVVVRTYLPEGPELEGRRQKIAEAVGILQAFRLARMGALQERWLAEEDWAQAWKQYYGVHRVGRHWVVKPRWLEYAAQPQDRVIELDPGMAFGTGLHPTTESCLEALENLPIAQRRVLDLGTGSGILAIAAAQLGAAEVLALDLDSVAAATARDNVRALGLESRVRVELGTLGSPANDDSRQQLGRVVAPQAQFDCILANLVARTIAAMAPDLAAALRPRGVLVASGIIVERESDAADALVAAGLAAERRLQRGDWVTLVAVR